MWGRSALGAWAALRGALAASRLGADPADVRARLIGAVERSPLLPESFVELAVRESKADAALGWWALADAARPSTLVPQPDGAGTWFVPARMSAAFSQSDPERAQIAHQEAIRRGAPDRADPPSPGPTTPGIAVDQPR